MSNENSLKLFSKLEETIITQKEVTNDDILDILSLK
jgi:hypothetical protein